MRQLWAADSGEAFGSGALGPSLHSLSGLNRAWTSGRRRRVIPARETSCDIICGRSNKGGRIRFRETMFIPSAATIDRCYDSALALIYPQGCAICSESVESRHDGVVCEACWAGAKLFAEDDALCWKCGAATAAIVRDDLRMIRCGRCNAHDFTAARACGLYAGVLRASVLGLKRVPHVGRRLLRALTSAQRRPPISEANLIIPETRTRTWTQPGSHFGARTGPHDRRGH